MSLTIRSARPDDHPTIARLFLELRTPDPPLSREQLETRMLPTVLVAEDSALDGAPIGYAFWLEQTGHVSHLVVDPGARNRGVGRALIEAVRPRMIAAGWKRWSLNVKKENAPAIALYRRCGFEIVGERWLLRTSFGAMARIPRSAADSFAPTDLDEIYARFAIDKGRLELWRAQGKVLVALRSNGSIVGLGAFDPGFPGFSMFHVADVALTGTLAEAARPHAKEDRLHVLVESAELAEALPRLAGAEILSEILHMTGAL
jgi:GNAT superfamily N-acetyltransferase